MKFTSRFAAHNSRRRLVALTLGLLMLVACGLVGSEPWLAARGDAVRHQFQQHIGGLGLGSASNLSSGEPSFDARLGTFVELDAAPLPAGGWLGGAQAGQIFRLNDAYVAGAPTSDEAGR